MFELSTTSTPVKLDVLNHLLLLSEICGLPINYKKVKFALEQPMRAQSGSRYISTLSLTSALDGVGG
jgi:hypothetical protein